MAESLASRVGRIVSGSLNALVAAVENAAPETVMEEAVREVDAATDDVRAELGSLLAKKHRASQRLMDENQRHEDLSGKLELALEQGREDLAEAAIARQLDIEAQIPVLERTIAECGEQEKELEGFISALQGKRRQMREELDEFRKARESAPAAGSEGGGRSRRRPTDRADRASAAFEDVMRRSTGVPGPAGNLRSGARLAELEELTTKNRIRERLEAAKARMAEKS